MAHPDDPPMKTLAEILADCEESQRDVEAGRVYALLPFLDAMRDRALRHIAERDAAQAATRRRGANAD